MSSTAVAQTGHLHADFRRCGRHSTKALAGSSLLYTLKQTCYTPTDNFMLRQVDFG